MACSTCYLHFEKNAPKDFLAHHEQLTTCLQALMSLPDAQKSVIVQALYGHCDFGRSKEAELQLLKDENDRMAYKLYR